MRWIGNTKPLCADGPRRCPPSPWLFTRPPARCGSRRSGPQQGTARLSVAWTRHSGEGRVKSQGFPGAPASGQPVWESWWGLQPDRFYSVTTQRYVERRELDVCVRRSMELLRLDSAPDAVASQERFVQMPVSLPLVGDGQCCLRYPRPVHSKR
jgi:hypothetical protein